MTVYEFHDVANIFPLMTENEFTALVNDIKENGLREPIWLYDNKIIDGRNRYRACIEAKVEPVFRVYDGAESRLVDFVISLNLHRRHLSTGQKACFAVLMLPSIQKRTKEMLSKKISTIRTTGELPDEMKTTDSAKTAGLLFGVSERSIFTAQKLHDIDFEIFEQVKNGLLSLNKAINTANKSKVTANLQSPDSPPQTPVTLTKRDLQRVSELMKEFGVTEQKATDYVRRQKAKRQTTVKRAEQSQNTMFKFQLPQDMKEKLQSIAKRDGKSIAELLRASVDTLYNV